MMIKIKIRHVLMTKYPDMTHFMFKNRRSNASGKFSVSNRLVREVCEMDTIVV